MIKFDENGFALESGFIEVYATDERGAYTGKEQRFISLHCALSDSVTLTPPPPAKDGFAIVLKDGKWEYEEDHRGQVYYDKTTRGKVEIKELGPISSNLTSLVPTSDHDRWNATLGKWELDTDSKNKADAEEFKSYKNKLVEKLKNTADLASKPLFDEFPLAEINSFPIQKAEALAYKSGENLKPTFLMSIAEKRKIPVPELVDKVIIKTGRYEKIMGEIAGKRQFIMDKFDHAVNKSDLDEINSLIDTWLEKIKKEQGADE